MTHGVYFVPSIQAVPRDAAPLIVGTHVDKHSLLNALAQACSFPDYFGCNWDAAWDCIGDSKVTKLLLQIRQDYTVNKPDLNIFIDLIADAFEETGRPELWVIGYQKELREKFETV